MGDLRRADGVRLAYARQEGRGPTVIFLSGYMSDMTGSKALALDAWAAREGRSFLRFDYAGCGQSEGDFERQTLDSWLADALLVIDTLAPGPVVLADFGDNPGASHERLGGRSLKSAGEKT